MEESKGSGAPSSIKGGFQVWTLGQRSCPLSTIAPSLKDLVCATLTTLALFWGSGSLEGMTSPSSTISLPFRSRFLLLSAGLGWEQCVGRGVGGLVWMATSSTVPPTWDSRSSRRLVLDLRCSTIVSGMLGASWMLLTYARGRWLKSTREGFGVWSWSKISNSSSKSETSTTLAVSSRTRREKVSFSSALR